MRVNVVDIAIVGEAWGEKEEETGVPFSGTSGWILDNMLAQVGINRRECLVTNVFNLRPKPRNDVINLCGNAKQGIPGLPPLQKGKYVLAQYKPEIERLYDEIQRAQPNIIIALGATAAWAFLRSGGIRGVRGSLAVTAPAVAERLGRQVKVLPTYHPAAVARDWSLRPVVISDLDKARRHSHDASFTRPSRHIYIKPTLDDLAAFEREHIQPASELSIDIETKQDQITCIGFAPSPGVALVIPFFTESGASYWRSVEDELVAWDFVRRWCAAKPTIMQNGMYDMTFLWTRYGIPCPMGGEDTMLAHHAYQPEMEKGLGFLASIYTDEPSWKFMIKGTGVRKHD